MPIISAPLVNYSCSVDNKNSYDNKDNSSTVLECVDCYRYPKPQ